MGEETKISWCDHTVNPWIGCVEYSRECKRCYAKTLEKRFGRAVWGKDEQRYHTKDAEKNVRSYDRRAARDGVRRSVFCASMSDFFEKHAELTPWREEWWDIIRSCKNLNWLILTKRAELVSSMLPVDFYNGTYSHVNLGVSVGVRSSLYRLDELRKIPDWGGFRWTSMEPLLESIGQPNLEKIEWAIVGGESTPGDDYTVMEDAWVDEIKDACDRQGTTFFFKQNSARAGRHVETFRGQTYHNFPWDKSPRSAV